MGLLDQGLGKPFSEEFRENQVFTLEDLKMGPTIPTKHGTGTPVMLKINGEWYSLFGMGLTNQVNQMTGEDREAMSAGQFRCKIVRRKTKSGQAVKLLAGPNDPDSDPDAPAASDDIPF